MKPFTSAEQILAFLQTANIDRSLEVPVADRMTFAGQTDIVGAGMAIVLDAILAQGYEPDGFDQCEGYRIYRYKKSE